ncbi:MAG: PKD domain-containing protein [Deltaproteobacteria bacterium]|nr:PKD domain-containing protein [Deltaproteobacteria bacterium]
MEKTALKRSFWKLIVLVLPLVLILGVLPCEAQQLYNLQDLIDNSTPIPVDNLIFSGFEVDYSSASQGETEPQAANITVEPIGQGTTAPGLKFTPIFHLEVPSDPAAPYLSAKGIALRYQVTAAAGSGLIAGSTLILNPGTLEPEGEYAYIFVEDMVGEIHNSVYRSKSWDTPSAEYMLKETLRVETNITPASAVPHNIFVGLQVRRPGGEASIESFEQRFSLASAPGTPIADAGPDLIVADAAKLDGSKSQDPDGQIASYSWKLKHRENPEFDREIADLLVPEVEVADLNPGFYDVELTVRDNEGYMATDSTLLAVSGPAGTGTEPKIEENAELNLWHFELKKYKYCRWSVGRMLGTFDLPDDFKFNRGDDLVGKVTIQLNRGDEPLVVMSDDIKLRVKKWKYKSVIEGH